MFLADQLHWHKLTWVVLERKKKGKKKGILGKYM